MDVETNFGALNAPITLLEQETRLLRPVLLVPLWLMDAVPVAGVLPVEVLLHTNALGFSLDSTAPPMLLLCRE